MGDPDQNRQAGDEHQQRGQAIGRDRIGAANRLHGIGEGEPLENRFRRDFESHYARAGLTYDELKPAYMVGEELSRDPDHQAHEWDEVESEARRRFEDHDLNDWGRLKEAVRYGFEQGREKNLRL